MQQLQLQIQDQQPNVADTLIGIGDERFALGADVFFSVSGTVDPEAIRRALAAEGLDPDRAPRRSGPDEALRRALDKLVDARTLRRAHQTHQKGKKHEIVAEEIVQTNADDTPRLVYPVARRLVAYLGPDKLPVFSPVDHPAVGLVLAGYEHFLQVITADDIHAWIVAQLVRLGATHKVDRGNIYFLPRAGLADWSRYERVLRQTTATKIYRQPVARSDGAIAWILDALTGEAERAVTGIEEELADTSSPPGARKLNNRVRTVLALKEKLVAHEALLDQALPQLHDRLERVRSALTIAVLASEAPPDES